MLGQTMRTATKNLLIFLLLVMFVLYFAERFPIMQRGLDFAEFYTAARIVHDGRGSQLYDPAVQYSYQMRYAGRVGVYFNHPPFEALIYLPFALLPLSRAYLLWCAFNAALLILVARLLAKLAPLRWQWQIVLPVFLIFVPLLLNFLQGQDALLMLFLWAAAFVALGEKRPFLAGCLFACALIKFQLTLPVTIPLLFSAPRKMLGGFVSGAVALLLLSIKICGWSGVASYPRFLEQMGSLPLAGIHNEQMANLRGLFGTMFPHSRNVALSVTLLVSLVVLGFAVHVATFAKADGCKTLIFANATLAAILVGYHLSPHDLSLLLLPLTVIAHHLLTAEAIPNGTRILLLVTSLLLFLPPLHLLLLQAHVYAYACVLIVLLFAATHAEIRRITREPATLPG